jgi:chromosome segregation and condensation protein ScpB
MEEWANRVFVVLFASAVPVDRSVLAGLIGRDVALEAVLGAVRRKLEGLGIEVARVGSAWMLRTGKEHAHVIRTALGGGAGPAPGDGMSRHELEVLAAIAACQPASRADLGEILGQVPGDALLNRLRRRDLIAAGPRGPGRGAPHTFVTTPAFLATFDFEDLQAFEEALPDPGDGNGRPRGARDGPA